MIKEKSVFEFEKSPAKKGRCPECGEEKKFRYYLGLPRDYGKCERINECGYINDPNKESQEQKARLRQTKEETVIVDKKKEELKPIKPTEVESGVLDSTISNFHKFCTDILGIPSEHLKKWNVGATQKGETVFGYRNKKGELLNLKYLSYKLVNEGRDCKRNKDKSPYYLKAKEGFKYERCFFGESLMVDGNIVVLVESEKSAVIASWFFEDQNFDFLATGGNNALPEGYAETLLNKKIYFIPDNDPAGKENSTIKKLKGLDFEIIDLFADKPKGWDLADELISGKVPEIKPSPIVFYSPVFKYDKDEQREKLIDVRINYTEWTELLLAFGFRRFDISRERYVFVKLEKQIISEFSITQIQDYFISFLKSLPEKLEGGVPRKMLVDKFYKSPNHYFNENRLSLLKPDKEIVFNSDTKDEAYIYFKNGFVAVNKDGWKLCDYKNLNGFIWKEQLVDKKFDVIPMEKMDENKPVFSKFMFNISGQNQTRFDALCTIVGYNIHSYFENKLKATVLTDSSISEDAEGRTGKTLLTKGFGKIRQYIEIPGKDFNPAEKYKYSMCNLDTQIVHINDAKKGFDFEHLYNDITEGITVDKKNQHPFSIKAKMILSTNKTVRLDGASSRDRSIEFELANHYSDKFSPKDDFGHWLFTDWDEIEWNRFYNFMMSCLCKYFMKGLIEAPEINLKRRKLLDQTCSEFIEFMEAEKITFGEKMDRKELHDKFLDAYPDYKEDKYRKQLKCFTKYLVLYTKSTDGFKEIKKGADYDRSNNMNWVIFRSADK